MYFLQHIQKQFFSQIFSYGDLDGPGETGIASHEVQDFLTLAEKELSVLDATKKIAGDQQLTGYTSALARVLREDPNAETEDPEEIKNLRDKILRLQMTLEAAQKEAGIIREQLLLTAQGNIGEIKENISELQQEGGVDILKEHRESFSKYIFEKGISMGIDLTLLSDFKELKGEDSKKLLEILKKSGDIEESLSDRAILEGLVENPEKYDKEITQFLEWWKEENKLIGLDNGIDGKEFTEEEIVSLESQRENKKEILGKIFQASLGSEYTGGDISRYKTELESGPLSVQYNNYMLSISRPGEGESIGEVYSKDIENLSNATQESIIILRDGKEINGEKFGDIRDEHLEELYKKLLSEGDEEILDILAPKGEDGERVAKEISELTAAEIGEFTKRGGNLQDLFLISESGEAFDSSDFKAGESFVLNIGENDDIHEYGLSHFTEGAKNILVEGVRAEYKEAGEYGVAGYYTTEGLVHTLDGMKISIVEMQDDTGLDIQRNNNEAARDALMTSSVGRDMYEQAIANPNDPIEIKGLFGKILTAILNALLGKNGEQGPDGTYGTRDANGNFIPLTGAEYMNQYTGSIRSYPIEYTNSGVTACGRTAWKNLKNIGANNPRNGNAHTLLAEYQNSLSPNLSFPEGMNDVDGPLQLFMDASAANAAKGYRHTACAFKDTDGNWQVLDPYYGMSGRGTATQNPIPAGTYMNYMRGTLGKQFYGAFAV